MNCIYYELKILREKNFVAILRLLLSSTEDEHVTKVKYTFIYRPLKLLSLYICCVWSLRVLIKIATLKIVLHDKGSTMIYVCTRILYTVKSG